MKRGDLIRLCVDDDSEYSEFSYSLYEWWGRPIGAPVCGEFGSNELGILLEDTIAGQGNGCKIITSSGIVGWIYRSSIEVV